jgi:glutamine amidotransferase
VSAPPAPIVVLDYGMGNLRSAEKALEHVGAAAVISGDPDVIGAASGLVLPGVGAFAEAMRRLDALGLTPLIRERAAADVPLLGICLGMQLLFDRSDERGGATGLGLLAGEVRRLETAGAKLPHIGWSPLRMVADSPLTEGIPDGEPVYFVHSFVAAPEPTALVATAEHGSRFAAIVGEGNVMGTQFHPEKSSAAGLRMLGNFAALCARAGAAA